MDMISATLHGFSVALTPASLGYTFLGVLLGTLVGVLPGLGPAATIALLLPISYSLDPTSSLMMMAGIYYGSQYGGSTTSILINTPGEASSMMTAVDGYQMAKQGRAGAALAVSAIGSFIAGTMGIVGLTLLATPLSSLALRFGPVEYFALMLFAMSAVTALAGGSPAKAAVSTLAGVMISTVGTDMQTGVERFTFGVGSLSDGINFSIVVVGMFAVGEVISSLQKLIHAPDTKIIPIKDKLYLTREDWRRSFWPMIRGSLIGFYVGVLPGAGGTIATMMSYAAEKKLSRHPEQFGKGAIEGVAAPEAANNGASSGSMVPLLSMGIPGSGGTAVLLGVFIMYGIQPGPLLFKTNPDLVWGLIASMYIGNVMLLLLNLPLVGVWVRLLHTPLGVLFPCILCITAIAIYGNDGDSNELLLMLAFGVIGYAFERCRIPVAPLILGLVLGDTIEQTFRQSLALSNGSPEIFFSSPIAVGLLALTAASLLVPPLLRRFRRGRGRLVLPV